MPRARTQRSEAAASRRASSAGALEDQEGEREGSSDPREAGGRFLAALSRVQASAPAANQGQIETCVPQKNADVLLFSTREIRHLFMLPCLQLRTRRRVSAPKARPLQRGAKPPLRSESNGALSFFGRGRVGVFRILGFGVKAASPSQRRCSIKISLRVPATILFRHIL